MYTGAVSRCDFIRSSLLHGFVVTKIVASAAIESVLTFSIESVCSAYTSSDYQMNEQSGDGGQQLLKQA